MNFKVFTLLLLVGFWSFQGNSQEICFNGIDDDNDGLIDGLDDDCTAQAVWSCEGTGVIMKATSVYTLNFTTGAVTYLGAPGNVSQSIGYNLSDNLIWGVDNDGIVFSLGSDLSVTEYPTTGDPISGSTSYNCAEVANDELFIYSSSENEILKVDIDSSSPTYLEVTSVAITGVNFADLSYNPIDGMLYSVEGDNQNLYQIDPSDLSMTSLGATGLPDADGVVSFGKSFSDANGNLFTYTTKAGYELENELLILKKVHDYKGGYEAIATVDTSVGGDGAFCYSNIIFTNEICDNGIDDDGDGDIDCVDNDCDYFVDCMLIDGTIASTDTSCRSGLATFQMFFTNTNNVTTTFDIQSSLATGFVFAHDSLDFSDEVSSFSFGSSPSDGDTGSLSWTEITLLAGETARLSYDAVVDENAVYGDYVSTVTISGANLIQTTLSTTITVEDCSVLDVFECDPAFYQVYKKKGANQPNVYGVLDPITGDYIQIALASQKANGLGFDTNTGLVYGASGKKFIQLEEDGNVLYLGLDFAKNCYRGDMDAGGHWWGAVGNDMLEVDPSVPVVLNTYVGQAMAGWDFAYNEDGNFYALHGQALYKFDTTTNLKSSLGNVTGDGIPTTGYGGQWTGSDGKLYASNNKYGSIVRVDVNTLEARIVSSSIDNLSQNDGFSCPLSIPAVYEFDYGDNSNLPVSRILNYYQDLNNDDVPDFTSVWIGETTTFDNIDPKNAASNGDDDDGFDISTEIIGRQVTASYDLNTKYEMTAYYGLAVDWDDDGVFDFTSFSSELITEEESYTMALDIPEGQLFGNVNARLIVSEIEIDANNLSGDILEMGETEDIRIFIYTPEDCTNGIDDDGDGLVDCDDPDCINADITSIYLNQSERTDLIEDMVVCWDDLESNPVTINSGVFGTSESVVFTVTGAVNEVITDNTSPYQMTLTPTLGEITISVAAYMEDNGGGMGICTAESVTFTIEQCVEICDNGIDDDYDGLTDCDDPDCQISASAGNDKEVDTGASTPLYGTETGGLAAYTYLWTPSTGLDDANIASPTATPASETTYSLSITDANGCMGTDAMTVYIDNTDVLYPCGWSEDGVLACGEPTPLACSEDFLNDLNYTYKEGRDLPVELSHALQYDGAGDIHILDDNTEVFVTFIHEGTPYQNTLTYYTYNTNSPLMDEDEVLNKTAVFPNMSFDAGESGGMSYGDKVSLGTFNSGTSIGFALITRGWQYTTQSIEDNYLTVYSSHKLNPETVEADKIHSHTSIDTHNNGLIVGFEEINREYLSCDHDFNDVMFLVSSTDSANDFDQTGLYGLYDNSNGNNCVPCGMNTSDIGLYKGTMNWGTLTGATGYRVRYRRWGTNDEWSYKNASTNTSLIVGNLSNLDPGTHYEWQVAAYFGAEQGCNSMTNVFTTLPECQMPTGNAASSITDTEATLSWGGVLSAERYTVRFKVFGAPDSEYQWRNSGANSFLTITGLLPETTYDWSVAATCGDSHSCYGPYQNAHNFTTETENRAMLSEEDDACAFPIREITFDGMRIVNSDLLNEKMLHSCDIDGDGLNDIIVSSQDNLNLISVYLNSEDEDSNFAFAYNVSIPEPADYLSFSDINNDKLADLIFTNKEGEKIWLMENQSTPGLVLLSEYDSIETDIAPMGIAGLNLNGGARKELISLSSGNDQVYLFGAEIQEESPDKDYASEKFNYLENFTTGKTPSKIELADFNGNGKSDAVILNELENTITMFFNRSDKDSLSYLNTHLSTGQHPVDVSTADLNFDGKKDVVVANAGDNTFSVYLNKSEVEDEFIFVTSSVIALNDTPKEIIAADLDGDRRAEIIVSYEESEIISIYQLTEISDMTYTINQELTMDSNVEGIAAFSASDDISKFDLAATLQGESSWVYFKNSSPLSKPAAEIVRTKSSDLSETELIGYSDISGSYQWEILSGGIYIPLEESDNVTGVDTDVLTIIDEDSFRDATIGFKVTDSECASSVAFTKIKLADYNKASTKQLTVAPNPSDGVFFVKVNKVEANTVIQILGPMGRVITEKKITESIESGIVEFDITGVSAGTYIVKLVGPKNTYTAKCIIK